MSLEAEQKFSRAFDALKAADLVEVTDYALDLLRSEGKRFRLSTDARGGLQLDLIDLEPAGEAA